jgi:hypothetical protein
MVVVGSSLALPSRSLLRVLIRCRLERRKEGFASSTEGGEVAVFFFGPSFAAAPCCSVAMTDSPRALKKSSFLLIAVFERPPTALLPASSVSRLRPNFENPNSKSVACLVNCSMLANNSCATSSLAFLAGSDSWDPELEVEDSFWMEGVGVARRLH